MEKFLAKNFFHPIVISEIFSYNHHKYGVNIAKTSRKLRNLRLENSYKNKMVNIKKYIPVLRTKAVIHVIEIETPNFAGIDVLDPINEDVLGALKDDIVKKYPQIEEIWKRGDIVEIANLTEYNMQEVYFYNGKDVIHSNYEINGFSSIPEEFKIMIEFPPNYWEHDEYQSNLIELNYNTDGTLYITLPNVRSKHSRSQFLWNSYPVPIIINPRKIKEHLDVSDLYINNNVRKWMFSEDIEVDTENELRVLRDAMEEVGSYILIKSKNNKTKNNKTKNNKTKNNKTKNNKTKNNKTKNNKTNDNIYVFLKYVPMNWFELEINNLVVYDYTNFFEDTDFPQYIIDSHGNSSMSKNDIYFISETTIYR